MALFVRPGRRGALPCRDLAAPDEVTDVKLTDIFGHLLKASEWMVDSTMWSKVDVQFKGKYQDHRRARNAVVVGGRVDGPK